MIVKKTLSLRSIYEFAGHHLLWLTAWMTLVTCIYYFSGWEMIMLPWLPVSLIGTAVAFYVGFKNNQSYDRLWEARKIWSDIAGNSKMFATMVKNYRSDEADLHDDDRAIRTQLIHRHIAYLYQLREQLLEPTQWEHVSLHNPWRIGYYNRQRRAELNNRFKEELDEIAAGNYISAEEKTSLQKSNNKAAQLLDIQSQVVQQLYANKTFNMIQQIDIQHTINDFYDEQCKVERIKQTPFPRKYASFSFLFVCIFIFVLPFGIVGEFSRLGDMGAWLSIPAGAIVGWVYVVMEMIGDYSENPFEGLHNDAPLLAICRDIEIDMLQMISENNIPKPIQPKGHVLL
jgi:putative membrane protein